MRNPEKRTLWDSREKSSAALRTTLEPLAGLLEEALARVDEAIDYFQKFLVSDRAAAGRVCALVAIKGRNLALGCYSLALDGLGQESGALLRPLLEAVELLSYLHSVPCAIEQALDGKLPTPGKRAKVIGGVFQDLRDQLSSHASHLGFGAESMRHLIDVPDKKLRPVQHFNVAVLEQNMANVFYFTAILGREAAVSFHRFASEAVPTSAQSLVNKAQFCFQAGEPVVKAIFAKRAALAGE